MKAKLWKKWNAQVRKDIVVRETRDGYVVVAYNKEFRYFEQLEHAKSYCDYLRRLKLRMLVSDAKVLMRKNRIVY